MTMAMANELTRFDARTALEPRDLTEALTLAKVVVSSKFFAVRSDEEALVILLTGRELGLTAMQSMRGIYVVQGRPMLSADLCVAVITASPKCEYWHTVESSAERCTIRTKRAGAPDAATKTWTAEDAKRADLNGKGIWKQYPAQMLRHRCAADLARQVYPDLLMGIYLPAEFDDAREMHAEVSVVPMAAHATPEVVSDESDAMRAVRADMAALSDELTPDQAAAIYLDHEGSSDDNAAIFDLLHRSMYSGAPKAALIAAVTIARLHADLAAMQAPAEAIEVWKLHRDEIKKLANDPRCRAWKALVDRTTALGQPDADAWLKAQLNGDGPKPRGGKPAPKATPANDDAPPAPDAPAAPAAVALAELHASVASKSDPGAVAGAYAKRREALGEMQRQGEVLTLERLEALRVGDERACFAFLDGVCRQLDASRAAKPAMPVRRAA